MNSWRFRDSIGALVVARVMRAAATNAQLPSLTNLTAAGARRPCPAPGHDRIVVRIVRIRAPGRRCPDGSCERRHGHGQADARAVRSVARRLDLTFPDGPSLFAWLARVLPGTMACLQDGHVAQIVLDVVPVPAPKDASAARIVTVAIDGGNIVVWYRDRRSHGAAGSRLRPCRCRSRSCSSHGVLHP